MWDRKLVYLKYKYAGKEKEKKKKKKIKEVAVVWLNGGESL